MIGAVVHVPAKRMLQYVSLFFVIKKNNSLGIRCAYRNIVRGEVEPRGVFGGGSLSKNCKKNPFLEKPVREYLLDIVIITQHYKKLMYQTQI